MRQSPPQEPLPKLIKAERYERIDIALARDGLIEHNRAHRDDGSDDITPYIKDSGEYKNNDTHKFDSVTQLETGLGIVGYGYKCHVKHSFTVEPP